MFIVHQILDNLFDTESILAEFVLQILGELSEDLMNKFKENCLLAHLEEHSVNVFLYGDFLTQACYIIEYISPFHVS